MFEEIGLLLGIPLTLYLGIILILTGLVGIIINLVKNRSSESLETQKNFGNSVIGYSGLIFLLGIISFVIWLILEYVWNPINKLNGKKTIILGNDSLNCKRDNKPSELCDTTLNKTDCEKGGICKYVEELEPKCRSIYTTFAEHNNSEYTYVFSILLNDISYRSGEKKTVFKRVTPEGAVNPHVYLHPTENDLIIQFSTNSTNDLETTNIKYFNKYEIKIPQLTLGEWYTIAIRFSVSDREIRVFVTNPGPAVYISRMIPLPSIGNKSPSCTEFTECSEYLQRCNVSNNERICFPKEKLSGNSQTKCNYDLCWFDEDKVKDKLIKFPELEIGANGGFDGMLRNFIIFNEALTKNQIEVVSLNLRNSFVKPDLGFMKSHLKDIATNLKCIEQ